MIAPWAKLYRNKHFMVLLCEQLQGKVALSKLLPNQRITSIQILPIEGMVKFALPNEAPYCLETGKPVTTASCDSLAQGELISVENIDNKNTRFIMIIEEVSSSHTAEPLTVSEVRPWGSFTILKDEKDFKLKQLQVNPGGRLSLQRHRFREEHWIILSGHPNITLGEHSSDYKPKDYIHVPKYSWHRIENKAPEEEITLIELQCGSYFGEDDIERAEDDYGRV